MPTHNSTHNPWRDIMIDVEDFKPQIKALGEIRKAAGGDAILKTIANNTIRAMRNYRKLQDGSWHQRGLMCVTIGKYIMDNLAAVTKRQWESERTAKIIAISS